MKCWHCNNKSRNLSDAYIKFAVGEIWKEKRIWLCPYCYLNLKKLSKS